MKTYTKDDIRYFTIPAYSDNSYDIICVEEPSEFLFRVVTGSPSWNDDEVMSNNIETGHYNEVEREDILNVITESELENHIRKYLKEVNE